MTIELKDHQTRLINDMAAKVFGGGGPHLDKANLPLFGDMGTRVRSGLSNAKILPKK